MTQAEKLASIRSGAVEILSIPEDAVKVAVATYIIPVGDGYAKAVISAIKDPEYDPEVEKAEYERERAIAAETAKAVKEKAEAKKALDIAKKEAKAKEKAEKAVKVTATPEVVPEAE